jgi:hypothetical protein
MKRLNLLLTPFDYMYYRISKVYKKRDGEIDITALLGISLFLCLLIFVPTLIILQNNYGLDFLRYNKSTILTIFIPLQILLLIMVYIRYKKIDNKLVEKWKNEKEPNKSLKGLLVIIALLLPIIILITYNIK